MVSLFSSKVPQPKGSEERERTAGEGRSQTLIQVQGSAEEAFFLRAELQHK